MGIEEWIIFFLAWIVVAFVAASGFGALVSAGLKNQGIRQCRIRFRQE
jgi:hypothetical protein